MNDTDKDKKPEGRYENMGKIIKNDFRPIRTNSNGIFSTQNYYYSKDIYSKDFLEKRPATREKSTFLKRR